LDSFRKSPDHLLLVAQLVDQYGTYGKIGLALIDKSEAGIWKINLFLMSCRVMSRGVGNVFLSFIINSAREAGVRLISEFISNDRNRIMYITYKFAGFREIEKRANSTILEHTYEMVPPYPDYISLETEPLTTEKTNTHV
jgi:FkbH-like protein